MGAGRRCSARVVAVGLAALGAACGDSRHTARTWQDACAADTGVLRLGPAPTADDSGRVFSATLTSDEVELYVFKQVGPDPEDYGVFSSRRQGGRWSLYEPVPLGEPASDLYPSLSPDGERLVFSSYRPIPGDTLRNAHLWMSRRGDLGWGTPVPVFTGYPGHYHASTAHDSAGDLFLAVVTPDWSETYSVRLRATAGGYGHPDRLPEPEAVLHWREVLGDSAVVWGGQPLVQSWWLVQISSVDSNVGDPLPSRYFLTRPESDGWTTLRLAGGGLGEGAPNFATVSTDRCRVRYTRDYASIWSVPMAEVIGDGIVP